MDEKVEERTGELLRRKQANVGIFHYGRNVPSEDALNLRFTRNPKRLHAPYSTNAPYTDAGSYQSRKYFTRPDYIIQDPNNGAMQVRGQVARIRKPMLLHD